jgi:hypothetical protein
MRDKRMKTVDGFVFLLFASSDPPLWVLFGSSLPPRNPRYQRGVIEVSMRYHRPGQLVQSGCCIPSFSHVENQGISLFSPFRMIRA